MSFSRFVVNKLAVTAKVCAIAGGHDDDGVFVIQCVYSDSLFADAHLYCRHVCTATYIHGVVLRVILSYKC
jgi:uncharacterized C2H2 Zn-finger protein